VADAPGARVSGLLVASLALCAISLLVPAGLGPLGPLAAGVLAFAGDRAVRRSGGALRSPGLARVAMTAALAVLLLMAWQMVRTGATRRAQAEMRDQVGRVEALLRGGTAEGAWDLIEEDARAGLDRAAFVGDLRAALLRLGPLESLGDAEKAGSDWDRTASFEEGDRASLDLPVVLTARFRGGPGRIRLAVRLRREGAAVTGGIRALRVEPGAPGPR